MKSLSILVAAKRKLDERYIPPSRDIGGKLERHQTRGNYRPFVLSLVDTKKPKRENVIAGLIDALQTALHTKNCWKVGVLEFSSDRKLTSAALIRESRGGFNVPEPPGVLVSTNIHRPYLTHHPPTHPARRSQQIFPGGRSQQASERSRWRRVHVCTGERISPDATLRSFLFRFSARRLIIMDFIRATPSRRNRKSLVTYGRGSTRLIQFTADFQRHQPRNPAVPPPPPSARSLDVLVVLHRRVQPSLPSASFLPSFLLR